MTSPCCRESGSLALTALHQNWLLQGRNIRACPADRIALKLAAVPGNVNNLDEKKEKKNEKEKPRLPLLCRSRPRRTVTAVSSSQCTRAFPAGATAGESRERENTTRAEDAAQRTWRSSQDRDREQAFRRNRLRKTLALHPEKDDVQLELRPRIRTESRLQLSL